MFGKKPRFRKILMLPVLLMFLLVTTSLFLLFRSDTSNIPIPKDFSVLPPADSIQAQCGVVDTVEYFYYAVPEELPTKNNKFGIYIYAEQRDFFELAQKLVNSNGGDWGYVLIPYNVKDYDYSKWRGVFARLYNKHLIPIIQLWDVDPSDYENQTKKAARFLDSFVWPIKQRYISVYNETNDAKFWKGYVNPAEYAHVLEFTIDTFKDINPNFFMLNGAFNTSASTDAAHMDAESYMYFMNEEIPDIFEKLDGWASHSYPQPNFSGSPTALGRWSIRAYDSELDFLYHSLGVTKRFPVFITETGWAHAEGTSYNSSYLSVADVAANFKYAYEKVWLPDNRVRAVIPFTIWYDPPYDHFAWVNKDTVPYEHYEAVKSMQKIQGTPEHLVKGALDIVGCK